MSKMTIHHANWPMKIRYSQHAIANLHCTLSGLPPFFFQFNLLALIVDGDPTANMALEGSQLHHVYILLLPD